MDAIHSAIRDYIQSAVTDTLENILTDFEAESTDEKSSALLRRLIEYYSESPHAADSVVNPKGRGDHTTHDTAHASTISPGGNEKKTLIVQTTTVVTPATTAATVPPEQPSGRCPSIMKSGARKGTACGMKATDPTGFCGRHKPKAEKTAAHEGNCVGLMKTGARKGQPCGASIPSGEMYCAKHKITKCIFKKADGNFCGWSISRCSPSESYCRIHIKDELNLDTRSFVLHTNMFGNKEHRYSGLVFEDKKVIGAQNPTGTISTYLDDEDLECVRVYGLPLSEPFVEKMKDYLKRKQTIENDPK